SDEGELRLAHVLGRQARLGGPAAGLVEERLDPLAERLGVAVLVRGAELEREREAGREDLGEALRGAVEADVEGGGGVSGRRHRQAAMSSMPRVLNSAGTKMARPPLAWMASQN